jgi:hypothetical protein
LEELLDGVDVDRSLIRPVLEELLLPGAVRFVLTICIHDSEELCQEYCELLPVEGLDLVAIITGIVLVSCILVPAIVSILVAECRWLQDFSSARVTILIGCLIILVAILLIGCLILSLVIFIFVRLFLSDVITAP